MKKFYFLIIVALTLGLVLTGCSLLSNISQVPATDQNGITYLTKTLPLTNLVGLWHFNEGAGDIANDSSGNYNHGTVYGENWVESQSGFGKALKFDGVNNYVEVPDSASLDITGEITIECWVKREQAVYQTLISKWSAVDNQRSYLVALTADNNVRFWITSGGTWGTLKELTSSGTVGTEWTHIAATYDGTKMNIYIDSVEDLSQVTTTVPIFAGAAPLMFGVHPAYMTHGWVPGYFKGILDEVRIWNVALLPEQLDSIIYDWDGFFRPVDNLPIWNAAKAGSAIPVKFSLNGDQGLDIFEVDYPNSYKINCNTTAPLDDLEETVTAGGGSSLNYDATDDQYIYVWKTDKSWAGTCRRLEVRLKDGTSHFADFKFK